MSQGDLTLRIREFIIPSMKAAISLPDDLFEAGEVMIQSRGWTRSRLYSEALREYLQHQDPSDITDRLNRVHNTDSEDTRAIRRRANRQCLQASDW